MLRVLLLCWVALLGAQDSNGSYGKLYPVDDGAKDESFRQFRQQLIAAVDRRDVRFIESILDPKILNSFGGDGGPKEFRETWKLDRPRTSQLWLTLRTILSMGSGRIDEAICAPYVFIHFPERKDLDVFSSVAVIKRDAPAYARPDDRSPVLCRYSYDVLRVSNPSPAGWWRVELPSGGFRYIRKSDARSAIAYRACFEKRGIRWLMTTLVAGD